MDLPETLLAAITHDAGCQVTLVIGAGCSVEPPTCLPLSKELSRAAHTTLVDNKVIAADSCEDPEDLSAVAAAVRRETGKQEALIRVLPRGKLRTAEPNRGYQQAAALLREQAIGDVITLNFDLAQTTALSEVGAGDEVAIIDGPEFHDQMGRTNLIYLHRNANQPDPEEWILTQESMKEAWEANRWEAVVVRRSAAAPVVVFAGLGSPADVIEHSVREIRKAVDNEVFLVDPGDFEASPFFKALDIDAERVIPTGWVEFMDALAERVALKQRRQVLQACRERSGKEGWEIEEWMAVEDFLRKLDLLDLGRLRASWTLRQSGYSPVSTDIAEQLAELFAVFQLLVKATDLQPGFLRNGAVVFVEGDGRPRATLAFVTGRGARSAHAIEAEIEKHRRYGERGALPSLYILAGVSRSALESSAPEDVVVGGTEDELIGGWEEWGVVFATDICSNREVEQLIA